MADVWHCRQIPNGDEPIVVCEREDLLAEIERLRERINRWGYDPRRVITEPKEADVQAVHQSYDALIAFLTTKEADRG